MKKILLVDDEQNVLNALRRELREHFDIATFTSPAQALEHCRETKFDLVVADYKMPEMNGIEFLKQFGQLQPDAARLVLSGEADIDALIRSINETHIYRFLAKPWDHAELLSCIRQALAYRDAILEIQSQTNPPPDDARLVQDDQPYQIVVVEPNPHLANLISRGLTDEGRHGNLYGAMQQEATNGVHFKKFKCVVNTFDSAQEAISHMGKNHCDLVIAAQSLPDTDGIQFLSQIKLSSPDVARILLSNFPDKTMLSHAINTAEVQNFLQLHWSSHELRADMRRQAWNLHQLKTAAMQALAARDLLRGRIRSSATN